MITTRYVDALQATQHISDARRNKIVFTPVSRRRFINKQYNGLTISNVYKGTGAMKCGKSTSGKPFKTNNIVDHIKILKPFLRWLNDEKNCCFEEKKIEDIKARMGDYQTETAGGLLSPGEIIALINAEITAVTNP
jgi:hypothetical protein